MKKDEDQQEFFQEMDEYLRQQIFSFENKTFDNLYQRFFNYD